MRTTRARMTRTAGSPSSGTTARRTSGRPPSHFSRPRIGSASPGYRTTAPAAEGLDWFDGFGPAGVAELRAAAAGRAALEKHLAESDDEPEFTPEDEAALAGEWSWFIDVVRPALAGGMGGFIDDDLAGVGAWGFDPADVIAPALFLHGGRDRVVPAAHGEWLARHCPSAELWLYPEDGHISVLNSGAAAAMGWLRERAEGD